MVGFAVDVSAAWGWGGALVWSLVAVAGIYRFSLLRLPETSGSFPFSFKQFLVMALALCSAAGFYFASFAVSSGLVNALQYSLSSMLPSYTSKEWTVLSQILGMVLGVGSITLVREFLPNDALSTVVGSGSGVGKLFKGAAVGVLVYPVILFTAWIVGAAVSVFSTEPKVPQLSLELFLQIPRSGATFWGMVGVTVLAAPYVEEMLFRGFLQGFFNGLVHPSLSVLATAAAFSALHYSVLQKGSNYEIVVGLFLFSIIASNLREREDSILASIGYHAAYNITTLAVLFWCT